MDIQVERESVLLDNETIQFLNDTTPCPEGGGIDELLGELNIVANAIKETGVDLIHNRAKLLFFLRGVYFLGVQRGAEAYRECVGDEVDPDGMAFENVQFQLSDSCAETIATDLNNLTANQVDKMCRALNI